jgi:plastocyanin
MVRRAALVAAILVLLSTGSASAATSTVTMLNTGFVPANQTVALGDSVKWHNASTKKHTATPVVNWSWSGVTVKAGKTSVAVYPTQAGSWPYFCSLHPTRKGTIGVPLTIEPAAGTTGTLFKLTLGTVAAPGVSVHEVYARLNGGPWQLRASTQTPTWSLLFTSPGTYELRTRMRWMLGSAASDYSPITTFTVF